MSTNLIRYLFLVSLVVLFSSSSYAQSCPGGAGCLDPTFGTGGKLTIQTSSPAPATVDIAVLPDGKILELLYGNRLVRLNADGTPDQTFGSAGLMTFPWPSTSIGYANALAMRLQDVGGQQRIVLAGGKRVPSGRSFADLLQIGRFMLDGSVDASFGTNGTVVVSVASTSSQMNIQADGKIVMLDRAGRVVRTNIHGSLDTGFGSGGIVNATYNYDLAIDGNGGILVGDTITTGKGTNSRMLLALKRYNSSGAADTTFGSAGIATADFNVKSAEGAELAVDPYGNIVVAGGVVAPGNGQYYFAAARFTSNGLVDSSFGGTGKVRFTGMSGMGRRGVLVQDDGKVVLTGRLNEDYVLVRYNYDGTLDSTFGNGGRVVEDVDSTDQVGTWVIQMDPGCACSKIIMSSAGLGVSFARFNVQ